MTSSFETGASGQSERLTMTSRPNALSTVRAGLSGTANDARTSAEKSASVSQVALPAQWGGGGRVKGLH